MSDPWSVIVVAAIASIGPIILGVATLLQGKKTHETFNSKMDTFLKLTKAAAFAEGKEQERDKNEKENKAVAVARLEVAADLKSESKPVTPPTPLPPSQPS